MEASVLALPDMAALRQHVKRTLCDRDRLDPAQAVLSQAAVTRKGKPVGTLFQVAGPRMLRTYAIWASDEMRILFFDSTGARFAETRLCEPITAIDAARRLAA